MKGLKQYNSEYSNKEDSDEEDSDEEDSDEEDSIDVSEQYMVYDINEDEMINKADIEFINDGIQNTGKFEELNLILDYISNEDGINEFIDVFEQEYNYNKLDGIEIDAIVNSYENLDTIINKINESINLSEILSALDSYKDKTSKVTYSDVETAKNNLDWLNYDLSNNGRVEDNDIEIFNKFSNNLNNLESLSKDIIEKNDVNGDGKLDVEDEKLYEKLNIIKNNSELKNAITAGDRSSNQYDSNIKNRENHPIYAQNEYSKENNKVKLEVGDTVTYTIKLTNTGKYPIKVTEIIDEFDENDNANLTYIEGSSKGYGTQEIKVEEGKLTIGIRNALKIESGQSEYFTLQFKVDVPKENTTNIQVLKNTAEVTKITNKNDIKVFDSHETDSEGNGEWNNTDSDWVETKIYKVSLEKFVSKVNGKTIADRDGTDTTSTDDKSEHKYDNQGIVQRNWKYNNPVEVSKGDKVEYKIKVKNDGDTYINIAEITDDLPFGIKYNGTEYKGNIYCTEFEDGNGETSNTIKLNSTNVELYPGGYILFTIEVEVIEPNMSNHILKNVAEIVGTSLTNKNGAEISDSTGLNNKDADYIQLDYPNVPPPDDPPSDDPPSDDPPTGDDPTPDVIIGGYVWNDIAQNKTQDKYDAIFDENEKSLKGIKVMLYRNGIKEPISIKYTGDNGYYSFVNTDIEKYYTDINNYNTVDIVDVDEHEKFIKGPKAEDTNRWEGSYYSYYVVFEYDGITYTSTPDGQAYEDIINSSKNYTLDSNAREKSDTEEYNGNVSSSRKAFNNKFSKINNDKGISYITRNEKGYIPQSIHQYNSNTMAMQSSTKLINLGEILSNLDYSKDEDLSTINLIEDKLKYVGLGLRGRDIFDLELSSVVDNIKVSVNGQQGVYNYNKVTLRKTDLTKNATTNEDMANIVQETSNPYVEEQGQNIRTSDVNIDKAQQTGKDKYSETQLMNKIEVTYKITVHNASRTAGTATKIINYYDNEYSINSDKGKEAYYYDNNEIKYLKVEDGESGTGYKSVVITTPGTVLNQSDKMEIYVVYEATDDKDNENDLLDKIKALGDNEKLSTYNMAEITEYTTQCGEGQTEHTRGLLDKDSAPGSVNMEQVRTTETEGQKTKTTGGNPTTLQYYFSKKSNTSVDLTKLKYEDDTYATPTLYFVADTNLRKISGTVFEDYTRLINNDGKDQLIRVKTGDGKKLGDEPGIKGVEVRLIEQTNNGPKIRYTKETDNNGSFEFEGFLPGNYYIEYHYGNNEKTFILDNNPNTKSYNGEDFQSTNNTGAIGSTKYDWIGELNKTDDLWYVYNKLEGVSTATDNNDRRKEVSTDVISFNDDQMTGLNNARDGLSLEKSNIEFIKNGVDIGIMGATQMYAATPRMTLTVEETVINNKNETEQNNNFSEYNVSNMNFGIAEVPVTTIDLQKHVYSFKITDSIGKNTLAAMQKDLGNTAVTVNPGKIAANRLETVINVLSDNLDGVNKETVRNLINYDVNKNTNQNISIKTGLKKAEIENIETAITMNSLAKEIKIVKAWKTTAGNVIAPPGTGIIDVSIENDKLQGAKLEVTYEITANIYAEKNFNNDSVTVPSIKGVVDYIDNNLAYDKTTKTINNIPNEKNWTIAKQDEIVFGERGTIYESRFGTLDPDGKKFNTALLVNSGSDILRESCGSGTTYITLEKVLTSADSILENILGDSDVYVYENSVEITHLDYTNQESGEDDFIYRDRVRTGNRDIILAGKQYSSATSETITIHPPTGDNSVNIVYYVIALVSLAILASGVFAIKKFVIKK